MDLLAANDDVAALDPYELLHMLVIQINDAVGS